MAQLHHIHQTTYSAPHANGGINAESNQVREQLLWKLLLIVGITYLIWSDKISIVLEDPFENPAPAMSAGTLSTASMVGFAAPVARRENLPAEGSVILAKSNLNNVTFAIDGGFARRNGIAENAVEAGFAKCRRYIDLYGPVARSEMERTGIPASITLAQGLLESNAGESKLTKMTHNHFGIKCYSHKCKQGHCLNFTDDSHKDFFVKYPNARQSFQAHSDFLKNSNRFKSLFRIDASDYQTWAKGLAKSGYASDKKYGDKLIALIQSLHLDRYDRVD
jgi:hypothetical protein